MSKKIKVPVSTLFDKIRQFEGQEIVRHSILLNFHRLGYPTRALVLFRVHKQEKELLQSFLARQPLINSLTKINNGYDFLCEIIVREMRDLERFVEYVEEQFSIKSKEIHYVLEEVHREAFLTMEPSSQTGTQPSLNTSSSQQKTNKKTGPTKKIVKSGQHLLDPLIPNPFVIERGF